MDVSDRLIDLFWCVPLVIMMLTVVLEPGLKTFYRPGAVFWCTPDYPGRGLAQARPLSGWLQGAGYSRIILLHILPGCFPVLTAPSSPSRYDLAETFLILWDLSNGSRASLGFNLRRRQSLEFTWHGFSLT